MEVSGQRCVGRPRKSRKKFIGENLTPNKVQGERMQDRRVQRMHVIPNSIKGKS